MKHRTNTRHVLLWVNDVVGKVKLYIVVLMCVQVALGINSVFYAMLLREIVNAAVSGSKNRFVIAIAAFVGLLLLHIALSAVYRFLEEFTRATMENRFKAINE